MRKIKTICNAIYWAFYRLTPKGRKAWFFKKSLEGLKETRKEQLKEKLNVVDSANTLLKVKKILHFNKGKSITKPKKSNHQVVDGVNHKHQKSLQQNHLRVNRKGKFKTV